MAYPHRQLKPTGWKWSRWKDGQRSRKTMEAGVSFVLRSGTPHRHCRSRRLVAPGPAPKKDRLGLRLLKYLRLNRNPERSLRKPTAPTHRRHTEQVRIAEVERVDACSRPIPAEDDGVRPVTCSTSASSRTTLPMMASARPSRRRHHAVDRRRIVLLEESGRVGDNPFDPQVVPPPTPKLQCTLGRRFPSRRATCRP